MPFVFLHDMQIKWHWDIIRSTLRVSLTNPLQGSWRAFSYDEQVGGGETKRFLRILNGRSFRNLNGRNSTLWSLLPFD